MSDDDIPVLTQILRTGDRPAAPDLPPVSIAPIEAKTPGDVVTGSSTPTAMSDALVIGNEAPALVIDGRGAAEEEHDEEHDHARFATGDESADRYAGEHAGDSFRLPQDHDHSVTDARATRFDEPEIGGAAWQSASSERDGERRGEERDQQTERRINPSLSGEPRERRQGSDDLSLQRLASITSSVRDSVLVALQTRIDTELDARIAQAMHREVETAIAHLQDKLRDGLTEALRDVVARAVDDEMTRFVAAERDAAARLDPRKAPVRHDA